MGEVNGWDEWGRHVLLELERLSSGIGDLRRDMQDCKTCHHESQALLRERVRSVEIRSSLWGAAAGLVTALGAYLLKVFHS